MNPPRRSSFGVRHSFRYPNAHAACFRLRYSRSFRSMWQPLHAMHLAQMHGSRKPCPFTIRLPSALGFYPLDCARLLFIPRVNKVRSERKARDQACLDRRLLSSTQRRFLHNYCKRQLGLSVCCPTSRLGRCVTLCSYPCSPFGLRLVARWLRNRRPVTAVD
jgi:hypothetical protein